MAVSRPEINRMISKVNFTDSNRGPKQIRYLVKHYVGATGGAEANCKYFKDTYRGASSHFFVGHNGEIWQSVEENDTAWHCGAKSYKHPECRNSNSIGVELCVKKDASGKWYYTEETKKAAVQLFAYLMEKYNIDLSHVLRHYDVTGKICGEPDVRSGNKVWSRFKKDVELLLKSAGQPADIPDAAQEAQPQPDTSGMPYKVSTTCDVLNIRAGAGTMYRVTGQIAERAEKKKIYIIVEEKNGWGLLKSGAGWISLAYTKKV